MKLEHIIKIVYHENQKHEILREMFPLLQKIIEDNVDLISKGKLLLKN